MDTLHLRRWLPNSLARRQLQLASWRVVTVSTQFFIKSAELKGKVEPLVKLGTQVEGGTFGKDSRHVAFLFHF